MNDAQLQVIRDFILRALKRFPRGVSPDILRTVVIAAGLHLADQGEDSLDAHLLYLEDQSLAKRLPKRHTASAELWAVSAQGDDYLRSAGLG